MTQPTNSPTVASASPSTSESRSISESRRDFLKTGTALAGGAVSGTLLNQAGVYAAGDDTLRLGLVGCGGRGTGAANQALNAHPKNQLVAMGDAFPEQVDKALETLGRQKNIVGQLAVDDDHKFSGLDAYKQVIDSCDVVLLATPPGFRPVHLAAAVEAGKHIFTEKPMATDAPGVRSVIDSVSKSKQNNTAMVAGFCWRYDMPRRALFERIHDGAIGDVLTAYGTYLTNPVKPMPPADTRPEGMSDLEWQVRNWYNFTWLCGDGLVEQACHTVDWLAWAYGDEHPASCTAVGGRQIAAEGGNIYDHIEVNYVWDNGHRGFLAQRQISGCHNENNLYLLGTKGQATITRRGVAITGETEWKYEGESPNMYQVEHDMLFESIRSGQPLNDGDRMVNSTMMAIMGRMAGYSGKELDWEMALNSDQTLVPEITDGWATPVETRPLPLPGRTDVL